MDRFVRLITLVGLFALSGCALKQLPPQVGNQAVLAIPKTDSNKSLEQWVRRYILVVSKIDDAGIPTEVARVGLTYGGKPYELVPDLEPGTYELTRMEWVGSSGWRATRALGEGYPLNIPVSLESGTVTVLPYEFSVIQEENGSGITIGFNAQPLDESRMLALQEDLKTLPNANRWNF